MQYMENSITKEKLLSFTLKVSKNFITGKFLIVVRQLWSNIKICNDKKLNFTLKSLKINFKIIYTR